MAEKQPERTIIMAVMDMQVQTTKMSDRQIQPATDYLRSRLNATRRYALIDKTRQHEKARHDDACQVPLGEALAAQSILRTIVGSIADFCTLSCEVIDLEKEAPVGGGRDE